MHGVLEMRGVTRGFKRHGVLQGLDLDVVPGQCTVLLGRNGAGKSTLFRLALGELIPTTGEVRVLGLDPVRKQDAVLRRIGYVPDSPDVPGRSTFKQLLRFVGAHYKSWDQPLAERLTDEFEVPLNQKMETLSRGQGMKAMMILALAPHPELLLLDEPFAGLDPVMREDVLRCVIQSLDEDGRTVLCATHELDVASRIAERVAILQDGVIARHGTVAEVLGEDTSQNVPDGLRDVLKGIEKPMGKPELEAC